MTVLFKNLARVAKQWREDGYPCADYPLIGEILRFQFAAEVVGGGVQLRYLRDAQFRALEVYWFLRLKKGTPLMWDLYENCFGADIGEFCNALGVNMHPDALKRLKVADLKQDIQTDEDFVLKKKIQPIAEMARMDYPSYILALAMGGGKTVLIGTIIATEFAMAMAYRGKGKFMKNALVFAPGRTILESLREIDSMPFAKILPPALMGEFAANLKIEYARDGMKDIGAQKGSAYNLIISNTEKIALRASVRNNKKWDALRLKHRKRPKRTESKCPITNYCIPARLGNIFRRGASCIWQNRRKAT